MPANFRLCESRREIPLTQHSGNFPWWRDKLCEAFEEVGLKRVRGFPPFSL